MPKRNMIVIASFTSIASPPFEGKLRPPKIQLYFHCNLSPQYAQAFLFFRALYIISAIPSNLNHLWKDLLSFSKPLLYIIPEKKIPLNG